MKKVIILLMVLCSLSVYSQDVIGYIDNDSKDNYQSTKDYTGIFDTLFMGVEYRNPVYYYGLDWVDECAFNSRSRGISINFPLQYMYPYKRVRYMYTYDSLKVKGLAVVGYFDVNAPDLLAAGRIPDYAMLYEATDTSFELLVEKRWDTIINRTNKKLELVATARQPYQYYYPTVYEVYFDSAVVVYDSFYVGVTNFNVVRSYDSITNSWLDDYPIITSYYNISLNILDEFGCYFAPGRHKVKYDPMLDGPCFYQTTGRTHSGKPIDTTQWYYSTKPWDYGVIVFPIIDTSRPLPPPPPDTCADISNFRQIRSGVSYAAFSWDNSPGDNSWEVAYGTEGTLPENCTVVGTPHTIHYITHLDSGQWYVAYVRAVCDSNLYSRWSDSIRFYIAGDTTRNNDIIIPNTILEENTHILPNPAKSIVNIFSSFAMSKIEVFSLNGVKVKEEAASGIATEIDVSLLPKGTYIVKVHTSWGIAMKKLIVN